ncbi:sugar transferase [Eubacterium limosum]|uniref:UDP-galactose phosphate transferase n=1 Tax=Eubacterium limosum TaxID=1736 RepID=A0AAC9W4Q8_EUBLI|nr:sugar transferase [Eubacterium limosum]ARD67586.1 UDP-galactose phosphate transferase [Eubacterium limosum]PWW56349.1 lipopolysaccharide/colanic/teichoic acid biosynthesis glycosyltransferase [Eubacterium limosum]
MIYQKYVKRILDITLSCASIIVLSPVMGVTAILVKQKLGSPVIFKQKRPGKDEKIFTMYKFRTMTDERDEKGELLPDSIRLTKFGKMLRSTSLDELPELFNIFKGDMSIVGPRPQLIKDLVFMTPEQRKRQTVLPGLTGWAQINGRNDVTWEDKFKYDLEYLKNISFLKDYKIIVKTITKVFVREGINAKGMDTAEDLGDYLLKQKMISLNQYNMLTKKAERL